MLKRAITGRKDISKILEGESHGIDFLCVAFCGSKIADGVGKLIETVEVKIRKIGTVQ